MSANLPYSPTLWAGDFLYMSGQIPKNPQDPIETQIHQVLDQVEALLKKENLNLENVVKVEIYLKNMDDFPVVNKLYAEKFSHERKPTRQTMQVAKLPYDVGIEISCIAHKKK